MKKKSKESQIKELAANILSEIDIWNTYRDKGGSDPNWPDGVGMNLIRNHIISCKRQLLDICQENELPQEYYIATPPEVDNHYMAPKGEWLKQRENVFKYMAACGAKPSYRKPPKADIDAISLF